MKKQMKILIAVCIGLTLTACGSKNYVTGTQQDAEHGHSAEVANNLENAAAQLDDTEGNEQSSKEADAKEVMLVYMVGSNLESQNGMATLDIYEMITSGFNENNLKVILCTGGASSWYIEDIAADACSLYEVTGKGLLPIGSLENRNMAQPETLTEFLNYGYNNYEADYYGLVLWNHGGGAVLGFGADENYDYDSLSLNDIDTAMAESKIHEDGKKFEWVGFDACLMGMIEVADMMADYSGYLIASEEIEAGSGWDYSFLKELSDGEHFDGNKSGKCIIDAYENFFRSNRLYILDYTLSCMDLEKVDMVVDKLRNFVKAAGEELTNESYSQIAKKRDESKAFGKITETSFYDTVDLGDLANKMSVYYSDETEDLQAALKEFIVYEKSNVPYANGVAIYFPYENKEYAQLWLDEYETMDFSPDYMSFLEKFTQILSGDELTSWEVAETAPTIDEENTGEYFIQLTEAQTINYSQAYCSIWEKDAEDSYICWLNSRNVNLSEDGKLSTDFDGKRFFIGDTTGNEMACCAFEIEHSKEYSKYTVPIIYMKPGETGVVVAYVHIRVDAENPEGVIVGVYDSMDTDETLMPAKSVVELEEGVDIYPAYFARNIIFNADGSVAPFEKWEGSTGMGNGFILSGELTINLKEMEESAEYCCLFQIKDTQGNKYYTNPVYIK